MKSSIICVGASLVDEIYFSQSPMVLETSNPAKGTMRFGDVMANVARHLAALKIPNTLITALGDDAYGNEIYHHFKASGIDMEHALQIPESTGKYIAFHQPNGQLFTAICSDNVTSAITPKFLASKSTVFQEANVVVADTNLTIEALEWLTTQAYHYNWKLILEPVSVLKAAKLNEIQLKNVALLTPNEEELEVLGGIEALFNRGVNAVWVRKGAAGSTLFTINATYDLEVPQIEVIDSTGAGDAALAGWLFAQIQGKKETQSLQYGHTLALHTLQRKGAVDASIDPQLIEHLKTKFYP